MTSFQRFSNITMISIASTILVIISSYLLERTDAFVVVVSKNNDRQMSSLSLPSSSSSASASSLVILSSESTTNDVSDVEETMTNLGDGCIPTEKGSPKAELLEAIENVSERSDKVVFDNNGLAGIFNSLSTSITTSSGSSADSSSNDESSSSSNIPDLAMSLENTYVLPIEKPSEWILLYTNAPDLLGVQGGPLSQLVSIQHKILLPEEDSSDEKTLNWIFNFKPSDGIQTLVGTFMSGIMSGAAAGDNSDTSSENNNSNSIDNDTLKQTVTFVYDDTTTNNVLNLKLSSTNIESSRFGNVPTLRIPTTITPSIESFKVIFNDGDIRIDKSIQGDFIFIYQRTDKECEVMY